MKFYRYILYAQRLHTLTGKRIESGKKQVSLRVKYYMCENCQLYKS